MKMAVVQTGKTKVQADYPFQKTLEEQIELYNVNS